MTRQEAIAQFVDQWCEWPRATQRYGSNLSPHRYGYVQDRPLVEELAAELLESAQFQALRLGTWLGTTDGKILTAAVEMVSPPLLKTDVELLVKALTYAAELQREGQRQLARKVALGAVVAAAAAMLFGFGAWGRPRTA